MLVEQFAPQLLDEPGLEPLIAWQPAASHFHAFASCGRPKNVFEGTLTADRPDV